MTFAGRSWTRAAVALLAVAAAVNMAVAAALALGDPRRASDLWTMVEWCRAWLKGQSLYAGADAFTDYPPNAIVLLSPLALLPQGWVVPIWSAMALLLTPALPWLVMRCAAPARRGLLALTVPTLLYLCWAAPRTLLQFSLLSMTLACAAMLIADSRWLSSGVLLGLALFKPHIAGPFALWMLVTARVRSFVVAVVVVLLGLAVYGARAHEGPLTTAIGWGSVLGRAYGGADGLVGHTSLRAWAYSAVEDPARADAIWIALSVALLIAVCGLAMRDRSRRLDDGGMGIPAMFCLWSLLTIYHNGNNMILMLPAFAFLWFRDDGRTSPWRWLGILALQAALAFDVPVRLSAEASSLVWGRIAIEQFDRCVVLATMAWVSITWWRLTAARSQSHACGRSRAPTRTAARGGRFRR